MAGSALQLEKRSAPRAGAAIFAVLLLAFALRLGLALAYPTLDWPDEIFQTTEPAHRLAFGNGVITWEWRDGTRNWALPGLLAVIMRLTAWTSRGPYGYLAAIAVVLSALSLVVVWIAYRCGERLFGARAGLASAITCAVWYDLIYYGPKTLNEVVAAHLLVAGLYLGYWSDRLSHSTRLFAAGALLGAVVGLRIQLAPAVLVAFIFFWFRLPRPRWALVIAGAAVAFLAFGLLDLFTWGYPFASYVRSIQVNLFAAKSKLYGVQSRAWYNGQVLFRMSWLLPFSLWGMRKSPLLAAVAATIIATHSAIGHKEYRFIYPAVALLVILAGLAIAEAVNWYERHWRRGAVAVAATGIAVSLLSAYTWHDSWMATKKTGAVPAFAYLGRDRDVCGIGLRGNWFASGGYTWLHHDVPIFPLVHTADDALSPAFNALISLYPLADPPSGFHLDRCFGKACIYRRAGSCTPDPAHEINAYLRATGQ